MKKRVLLVDDEAIIREGLSRLIDWESLDCHIAGFSSNGNDACKKILNLRPDIVLMDIRMPGLSGLEVLERVRSMGYDGEIVILSGFSEFEYAKTAIGYDVCGYLTKPVDEDELEKTVRLALERIERRDSVKNAKDKYYDSLREQVVRDLLSGEKEVDEQTIKEYGLSSSVYQVVTYEKFDPADPERGYSFAELLMVSGLSDEGFVHLDMGGEDILFLIGEAAIHRFSDALKKYDLEHGPQQNSPLDTLFIAYGRKVNEPDAAVYSYQEAKTLMEHRFFCDEGVHIAGTVDDSADTAGSRMTGDRQEEYAKKLTDYVQSFNRSGIAETLTALRTELSTDEHTIHEIKLMLADMLLSVKERLNHLYSSGKLPFASNAEVIKYIGEQFYLYEILRYFSEQFERVMTALGGFSGDSVMDAVTSYINYNYASNITLENIAPLFGYNSSYLGKIFSKKMGETFNSFLDKVRITQAKKELLNENTKVYTVAERVGYKNVDYFHVKFKKYTGMSPAEYRRSHQRTNEKEEG